MERDLPYWFVVICMGLLTFFLIRFWYMVDEIRKDVKSLLISEAESKQAIQGLKENAREIKDTQRDQQEQLNDMERNKRKT